MGLWDTFNNGAGEYGNSSPATTASPGPPRNGGIAYPTKKNYVPSPEVRSGLWSRLGQNLAPSLPSQTAESIASSPGNGWQMTPTPQPSTDVSAPPSTGGLWGALSNVGNSVNTALTNPVFQFGIGMAGAGGDGKGLAGGLAAGLQNAPNAWKLLQAQRQMKFAADLNDPNSATYKAMAGSFSPASMAAIAADPSNLPSLFAHKGDLDNARAVAQITADAGVRAKIAEMQWQRKTAQDMIDRFGASPGGTPAAGGQPPMAGARQAKDGNWYVPDPNRPGKYMMVQP